MEVYLPYETPTGPQLEVLGEVETKLPQPVQRRATAWVLTAAVALAAVFGLGGMKLQSAHRAAVKEFTTGAHEEYEGFSLSGDLNERLEAGATLAKIGKQQLGETNAFVNEAFAQVDALKEALASGSPAACYRANTALGKAADRLVLPPVMEPPRLMTWPSSVTIRKALRYFRAMAMPQSRSSTTTVRPSRL